MDVWVPNCMYQCVAIHTIVAPLSQHPRTPVLSFPIGHPPRRLTLFGEANLYFRRRRAQWKSIVVALSIAGVWLGLWAVFLTRLG